MNTLDFDNALNEAFDAISNLKNEAENLKNELDEVIEACETIENSL